MTFMAHIKGITVTLITKTTTGRDPFNNPIETEERIDVENVLVAPVAQTDTEILSEMSLKGKKAKYQLAIPKGDAHNWDDCEIEFFGQRWKSVGFSTVGIEDNIPLDWNRKVVVERNG